jgi:hypothetical protein
MGCKCGTTVKASLFTGIYRLFNAIGEDKPGKTSTAHGSIEWPNRQFGQTGRLEPAGLRG